MIWEGFYFNSPKLEIYITTFHKKHDYFKQCSLVVLSKLAQDAEEYEYMREMKRHSAILNIR